MENKINIAELIKHCPQGTKLYSPLCGECYFDRLNMGTIICKKQNTQEITFTSEGYYMLPVFDGCECLLFPSKENRDWSKFQKPFKDGEIISNGNCICIYNGNEDDNYYGLYVGIGHIDFPNYFINIPQNSYFTKENARLATEEEKQKLFDVIKEHGHRWNTETKTLEKLIEPKFKVGDRIKHRLTGEVYIVLFVLSNGYGGGVYDVAVTNEIGKSIDVKEQDNYELVPNKFDISALKPFDKVLVRDSDKKYWGINLFGFYNEITKQFHCMGNSNIGWNECIPYEVNQHLLGTTDDCDEYFKTW